MLNRCVFAGSFDPFTLGHYDIVSRAAYLFDKVFIGVAIKSGSKVCRASVDQRAEIVRRSVAELANVEVHVFDDFLIDFARSVGANTIVRGIRTSNDFEYEKALMEVYKTQCTEIESLFLISSHSTCHISGTIVRELAILGGKLDGYVHPDAKRLVADIYKK